MNVLNSESESLGDLKITSPQQAEILAKRNAEQARGDKYILEYTKVLEGLMDEYIESLKTDPDEDQKRFKKYCTKWKSICVNAMKTHKHLHLHKEGFKMYYDQIIEATQKQIREDKKRTD